MSSTTYSSQGLIEIQGNGPTKLWNFKQDSSVNVGKDGTSLVGNSYYFSTVKGNVKGRWYYEIKVINCSSYGNNMRFGWSTEIYAPETTYDGCGSDSDSWSWDGSRLYHNEKNDSTVKNFGSPWSNGDILGCSVDFESREIRFTKNGVDLGVAFKNVRTSNPLMPCISVSSASIEVNFGPKFQRPLAGFYGVNPTVTPEQKKGLLNVFIKYHKKGADLNDSLSRDVMKIKGVMELGNDVGCVGPLDPHVLLLAWKMRSKRFFEFFDTEWMVLWANEGVSSFDEIKATISRWITDIEKSQDDFQSFYGFCFDYMKLEKGDRATALDKQDAQMLWELLAINKKFKFYPQWLKFWEQSSRKGITKDEWMMLLRFISKIGNDINNYSEDDCWPSCYDDFADFMRDTF